VNVHDERTATLRGRVEDWRNEGLITSEQAKNASDVLPVKWRTHGIFVQAVFFVLTAAAAGAFYGIFRAEWLVGAAALVLAEYLIRQRRWWRTGVEAALWLIGTFAFIAELPRRGTVESLLVLAAGFALPGVRLRNPVFGCAAGMMVVVYFEQKWDRGTLAALVAGLIASFHLTRTWRRPSTEWLWILFAVGMPVAALIARDSAWQGLSIVLFSVYAVVVLVLAVQRPHHALFLSALIAMVVPIGDAIDALPLADEGKLALAGGLALLVAWAVGRMLHDRTRGLVATASRFTTFDEAVEMAGAIAAASPEHPPDTPHEGGGGEFGGAGASGSWK
jgi:hypothetical protein